MHLCSPTHWFESLTLNIVLEHCQGLLLSKEPGINPEDCWVCPLPPSRGHAIKGQILKLDGALLEEEEELVEAEKEEGFLCFYYQHHLPDLIWSWADPWVWCYCLLPASIPGVCIGRDTIQKGQCSRLNRGNTIPAAGQWWPWTSSKWPYFRVRVSTPPMCPSPQLPVCCWDIGCQGCNIKKA